MTQTKSRPIFFTLETAAVVFAFGMMIGDPEPEPPGEICIAADNADYGNENDCICSTCLPGAS